jgi:hypothetical protein
MQIHKIVCKNFFDATIVLPEMVVQLAAGLGLSPEYIAKVQAQKLNGASKSRGHKGVGTDQLPDAKLRTIVLQKLQQANDLVSAFSAPDDAFEYEFTGAMFPDPQPEPDINAAGQNKRQRNAAPANRSGVQVGAYTVAKRGLKCTAEQDPEKFALWQFIWDSGTFEQYYAKAPKKAVTRTGRIITAASEMAWAIKSGWVVPSSKQA